jgi:predicted alpha/beta hydrolase
MPPAFGTTTQFPASAGTAPDAAVLLLPALATPLYAYRRVVNVLTDAGIDVAFMHYGIQPAVEAHRADRSLRGFGYLADVAIPRALRELSGADAQRPVWIVGHSLGAQVGVLAVKNGSADPDGLYFVAGGTPHHRAFPILFKPTVFAGTALPCAVSLAVGHWPGRALGIGADESADLVRDWATLAWTGSFDRLRKTLPPAKSLQPSIGYEKPIIAGVFADDNLAPRRAVEALCQYLPGTRPSIFELDQGGHMGWLRHPDPALTRLTQRIGSSQKANDTP